MEDSMAKKKNYSAAVIHLGSEKVTMQLIQYSGLNDIKILDSATHAVSLGEETFQTGRISLETIQKIVTILKGFRLLMKDYGIRSYILQATTAVREAENKEYFLDQIFVKTGFKIDVINMPREIFTKLASFMNAMGIHTTEELPAASWLMVDISSGGMGFTYMVNGEIQYQQNLHVGLIRLKEYFTRNEQASIHFEDALKEYIAAHIIPVAEELAGKKMDSLILSGAEGMFINKMLRKRPDTQGFIHITLDELETLYKRVHSLTKDQMIKLYQLTDGETELALPAAALYYQLAALAKTSRITIPTSRFIDGMKTLYIAGQTDKEFIRLMQELQLSQIRGIGHRLFYNKKHADLVEGFCCSLFAALASSQGLDKADLLYLRAAAALHGVGKYLSLRSHNLYNYEIIRDADLIGFSREERQMIAEIAFLYSVDSLDSQAVELYERHISITPRVAKLAAILRMADCLDVSRKNKVAKCKASIKDNNFVVKVKSREDFSLERWTFEKRGAVFEEVYGLKPVLKQEEV
jgi:exopolyphosphatase/guanosine-5'-triphosphate,3'-diphosphate pyrophosphatase